MSATTRLPRRALLGAGLLAPALAAPRLGLAQSGFPNRPITLICPFPPGGTTDITMRALAEAQAELILGYWWQLATATAFMAVFVTAFSLMADAWRDALDPKLRGAE